MPVEVTPDWYPTTRPKQRAMYANVLAKIENYQDAIVDLSDARVARIILICRTYIAVYDWLEQSEAALRGGYAYQKDMERGEISETPSPSPVFPALVLPVGAFKGFVKEFRDEMGLLKKQKGYTQAIGEDLMIVAASKEARRPEDLMPAFEYAARQGFKLWVTGRMQGMGAVKFYYRRKGASDWIFVGFLTKTPGEIQIPPAQAGVPEAGEIRAIYFDNNQEAGQFSTNTEVTLS